MGEILRIDKVEGLEEVMAKLKDLPDEVQAEILEDLSKYAVELFKKYPRQKYVTRKSAYGVTFFSDKQRKWFFAALNSGAIKVPYNRTQNLARMWEVVSTKKGEVYIANDAPYAGYVMGEPGQQSRHEAKVGWKSTSTIIKDKASQFMKRAVRAGNRALGKIGSKKISI